jgi:hypothetical protein
MSEEEGDQGKNGKTVKQQRTARVSIGRAENMGVSLNSSELNWYDLETKCQKLVFDIIQPNVVRE